MMYAARIGIRAIVIAPLGYAPHDCGAQVYGAHPLSMSGGAFRAEGAEKIVDLLAAEYAAAGRLAFLGQDGRVTI